MTGLGEPPLERPPSPTSISRSCKYSFDPSIFADSSFEPSTFLAAAKDLTPLEVLREHLRGYERDLKEELYNVINRDLADYLDLSSKLAGVETEVTEVKAPLTELSTLLDETKALVTSTCQEVGGKLQERRELRAKRSVLERRIRFLQTLRKVETVLGLQAAEEGLAGKAGTAGGKAGAAASGSRLLAHVEAAGSEEEVQAHCAALERAAHAWLSLTADLKCFEESGVSAASGLSGQMDTRLLKVEKALLAHLVSSLRVVVCPKNLMIVGAAAAAGQGGEAGKKQGTGEEEEAIKVNEPALRHLWRSFATIGRGDEAEKQLARLLMLPFIDLNFTQGRLDGSSRGSCSGLADIYRGCLSHIRRNLGATLRCAEECAASMQGQQQEEERGRPPLDLVANGVWKPLQQALVTRLGSIFAPGIASILHSNYTISMDFLRSLSTVCGPKHEAAIRARLEQHPSTAQFHGRWNLPVYFHLRFSEISDMVDSALSRAEAGEAPTDQPRRADTLFVQPVFDVMVEALELPWTPTVYLPPLLPRFYRLTLQTIARFHTWLSAELSKKVSSLTADKVEELLVWLWDTHVLSTQVASHELHLKIIAAVHKGHQQDGSSDSRGMDVSELVRGGLEEALVVYGQTVERAWRDGIEAQVAEQAVERLQAVRGITATYRMTNKKPPDRPSPFLPKILEPIRKLEATLDGRVPPALAQGWKARVAGPVCERYLSLISELLSSVDQMEDALKKRKQRAAAKGGTVADATSQQQQGLSDADKIKLQLLLDCIAFAAELSSTAGVEPLECEPYRMLLRAVAPALPFLDKAELKMDLPANIEAYLQPPRA